MNSHAGRPRVSWLDLTHLLFCITCTCHPVRWVNEPAAQLGHEAGTPCCAIWHTCEKIHGHSVSEFVGFLYRVLSTTVLKAQAGDYMLPEIVLLEARAQLNGHSKSLLQKAKVGAFLAAVPFLSVPQHLLLHAGLCCRDRMFGQAFSQLKADAGVEMDDRHLLCLLLIVERAKGSDSEWHPYISYLPQSYGTSCGVYTYVYDLRLIHGLILMGTIICINTDVGLVCLTAPTIIMFTCL